MEKSFLFVCDQMIICMHIKSILYAFIFAFVCVQIFRRIELIFRGVAIGMNCSFVLLCFSFYHITYLCNENWCAMTPEEEKNLDRLERALTRLVSLVESQRSVILRQQEQNVSLAARCKELEDCLQKDRDKYQTLLMARTIVANDKDWAETYSRLSVLQKEIREAIRLLELE